MNVTSAQLKNIGLYILIALGAAIIATGVQLGTVLSGTDPIVWRPLEATFVTTLFGTLSTAFGTMFLTRVGREPIAALVSTVGAGPAQSALESAAAGQTASPPTSDEIADLVVAKIETKMRETMVPGTMATPPGRVTTLPVGQG